MRRVMRVRILVFFVLLSFLPSFTSSAAQSDYAFEDDYGDVVLSNVGFDSWYDGSAFTVELSIDPSADEIDAFLQEGWSHVDIAIFIDGFVADGDDFVIDQSAHMRRLELGDKLIRRASSATVNLIGYKLEKWVSGRTLTISVSLTGEIASGAGYPEVDVVMTSSAYWPAGSDCRAVKGLRDSSKNKLCAAHGFDATLVAVSSSSSIEEADDDFDTDDVIMPEGSDSFSGCSGQFWPSVGEFELSESDGVAFSAILRFTLTQDEIDALGCSGSTFTLNFMVDGLLSAGDPKSLVSSDLPAYNWEMFADGGAGSVTSIYIPVYDLEADVDYFVTVDFLDLKTGEYTPTISFEWATASGDMVSLSDYYYGGPLPFDGWYVVPFGD